MILSINTAAPGGFEATESVVAGGVTVTKLLMLERLTVPEQASRASRETE
jgi:hypothetical protein